MSSGVRDALNLSWKLAGVIRGELPENILDTYEIERQPHVRELTQVAVNFGRIITERNRAVTSLRDLLLRLAMKTPRLGKWIHDGNWFPPPHYDRGYFASSPEGPGRPNGADGWLPVQPRVVASDGVRVLLDDALPEGWVVVTTRADRDRSMQRWVDAGVPVIEIVASGLPSAERLVDTTGALRNWLKEKGVDTVALRPDRYTYASRREHALPAPPFLHPVRVAEPATTAVAS
jgi:3-(3-hydroxy-phenyl)propionate hydroxylase